MKISSVKSIFISFHDGIFLKSFHMMCMDHLTREPFVGNQLAVQQGSTSVERSKFVTLASLEWPLARKRGLLI